MTEEAEFRSLEPMALSLDLELATLARATRGAQILAELQSRHGLMDESMEKDAPECVFSILALVGGRIDQLRRVVRSEENPANLWAPHNEVAIPEPLEGLEGDIIMFSWRDHRLPLIISRPPGDAFQDEEPKAPAAPAPEPTA
jgi:hypothetical protein